MLVISGGSSSRRTARIVELAAKNRLPRSMRSGSSSRPAASCPTVSDLDDLWRRAATYVDRILKGAKPGDLPIEQPTKFRSGDQPEDREGTRPHDPAIAAAARGRGDPVTTRRLFVVLMGIVAAWVPTCAWTQQPGRLQTVAILSPGKRVDMAGCATSNRGVGPGCFLEGLRALGYEDGRNVDVRIPIRGRSRRTTARPCGRTGRPSAGCHLHIHVRRLRTLPRRPRPRSRSSSVRPARGHSSGLPAISRGRSAT